MLMMSRDGVTYFVLQEGNFVWTAGDRYMDDTGELILAPDSWHMEDRRQSETIYRPVA